MNCSCAQLFFFLAQSYVTSLDPISISGCWQTCHTENYFPPFNPFAHFEDKLKNNHNAKPQRKINFSCPFTSPLKKVPLSVVNIVKGNKLDENRNFMF